MQIEHAEVWAFPPMPVNYCRQAVRKNAQLTAIGKFAYARGMAADADERESPESLILAENLARLFRYAEANSLLLPSSQLGLQRMSGVDRKTVRRALLGKSAIRIDNLGLIAGAYGMEAWQLLVPGINPPHKPTLQPTAIRNAKAADTPGLGEARHQDAANVSSQEAKTVQAKSRKRKAARR